MENIMWYSVDKLFFPFQKWFQFCNGNHGDNKGTGGGLHNLKDLKTNAVSDTLT